MAKRRIGSITELPSGRFQATVTLGRRADGKKRRHSKTFSSRADAETWVLSEYARMGEVPTEGVTVGMAWEAYEADKGRRLATATLRSYGWYMHDCWEGIWDTDVRDVDVPLVQGEISKMSHAKAKHAKAVISSLLTWCASVGVLARNPLTGHRFELPPDARLGPDDDVWDVDPFGAIEDTRDVWDALTAIRCLDMIRGLPLEPAWLSCIGAGMRVEEAMALRGMDLRRVAQGVGGSVVEVTQAAIHHARTNVDETKGTKTRRSVRIVPYLEPFGERMWEIARDIAPQELVCPASAANQNKRWRGYFDDPPTSKHWDPRCETYKGRLHGLPYIPLSKMRRSHETLMQEAGVLDSINAAMHGHSGQVARDHYMRASSTEASVMASDMVRRRMDNVQ